MNRSIPLVFVLIFLTASCITLIQSVKGSENSWASKAPMHQARERLGVASVNGKIYAIGGDTLSGFWSFSMGLAGQVTGGVVDTNEQYDPITDTWIQKTHMPTPRDRFAIATYQNKIYCIGGATGENIYSGATAVNEVYNPATDTWEAKSPFPAPAFPLQANVVNGKIYVLTYYGANYEYDPTKDSWTNKTKAPHYAFDGYVSAVINDKIYVIGGLSTDQHYNLNQIYDPSTDTWSLGTPPPTSIGNAVGEGAGGATTGLLALKQLYVMGQNGNLRQGEPPGTNRVYNPKADSWTYGVDVPTNRINFAVAVVNDTIYAIGGGSADNWVVGTFSPSAVNEQYIPIGYGSPDPTYQVPTPSPSPSPTIVASLSESASALNYGNKINFTVSVEGATPPYTFFWYVDGQLSENSTSPYYSTNALPVGSHHVYVQVVDAKYISATTLTVAFEVLPVSSPSSSTPTQQPTLSPTPTPTIFFNPPNLTLYYAIVSAIILTILIAIGAIVYSKRHKKAES